MILLSYGGNATYVFVSCVVSKNDKKGMWKGNATFTLREPYFFTVTQQG